jgi:hypothetical protein
MTLSLLQLCQALAKNVGIAVPTAVFAGTDRTSQELVQCANETGDEICRRVSWGDLRGNQNFTGDGTNAQFTLSAPFQRLSPGVAVMFNSGKKIIRQQTIGEFNVLPASVGVPRYFLLEGYTMQFWPYIPVGGIVSVKYQTESWCDNGATNSARFLADSDTPRVPDVAFLQGMIVRWRRQKGMDYADYEAEYEATLAQYADFNEGARL